MNKNTKTHTTQISTTRRKVLKKLSYSPPLLMCLGALTKPRMAGASHGPLLNGGEWEASTLEGRVAIARYNADQTPENLDLYNNAYAAYRDAYNALTLQH